MIITARDEWNSVATNFTGSVTLSGEMGGGLATDTILGSPVPTISYSGNFTLGYAFTPNTNLTVTHVRHYFGTKVSIWTDGGTLLAAQTVTSVPGTWVETPLNTRVQLTAGATYRVGSYTAGDSYYWRTDLGSTFPNGTIGQNYDVQGDAFPTRSSGTSRWFVDLRYSVGTLVAVPIAPTVSAPFTNGVWTGDITVPQPATNLILVATANSGHRGTSTNFDVLLANDLSVAIVDQPDPVGVGAYLTNTITVANSGPTAATGVMATNFLPASVTFVSATASTGSCVLAGSQVECDLGTLAGGAAATITVVTTPGVTGQITNLVTVGRAEADTYAGNNSTESVTTVAMPSLSIADVSVVEGNSGQTNMVFSVQLAPASPLTVTVAFATTDGTAQAGIDYVATNGILTFIPGQTTTNVIVAVLGDTVMEGHKTFTVTLSSPVNAVLADAVATGTILDDDAVRVSLFFDPAYVDTGSTTDGEATNVIAALVAKGCQVQTFTGVTPTAFSNALVGADILYIPELENGDLASVLSASAKSVISNFVAGGGGLIINGQGGSWDENFVNQVFGHSIASASWSGPTILTGAAAGTAFAGGPSPIPENNGTYEWLRSSLPAGSLSIYQDSGALYTTVAVIPRGAGKIIFLAYDWFNAVPRGTQNGGWDEVLRRAVLEAATPAYDLAVTPSDGWASSGYQGGPFNPSNKVYTLSNLGGLNLTWAASWTAGWMVASPTNGVLPPGGTTNVTVSLTALAASLTPGTNTDTLVLSNLTRAASQTRPMMLVVLPDLAVTPSDGWASSGYQGGPFNPSNKVYTLSNLGGLNLTWAASWTAGWMVASPTNGVLPPGGTTNVTVSLTALAASLPPGTNTDAVILSNLTHATSQTRPMMLVVLPRVLDHFAWSAIPSPQLIGAPFAVTITAQDYFDYPVTNFTGSVTLSGEMGGGLTTATNTILGSPVPASSYSGNWTLGYAFTPNINLTVTHVRHYFGTKVSIWTDGGNLLASQNVSSIPGTWVETPLASPVQLTAGVRYRVASYTGNGSFYWDSSLGTTFPNGTIDQGYEISGDAFPTRTDGERWFVDLRYTVGSYTDIPIIPTNSGNFVNGAWTGDITVLQPATNMYLVATANSGHRGTSTNFDVLDQPAITWQYNAGSATLEIAWSGTGFRLQAQTNGFGVGITTNWFDYPSGTNSPVTVPIDAANPSVFYRLVWP